MSNSDIAIRVEGLGKRYRIGTQESAGGGHYRYKSLRDSFGGIAKRPLKTLRQAVVREPMNEENSFWALKDINFEVKKGEVVGIIGRNGAGKSTLLKILSQITRPTTGKVDLFGRVGSLLEVGTGFHPELSGRENIYLNGAILGMSRAEVKARFDEIVAFSEIEKFLDTPVKQYSSGMYMRLAFAVAAHLDQEVLVVDEVLTVGDADFQRKCLGKLDHVAHCGRTVLIVSHNELALRAVCASGLYLRKGHLQSMGPIEKTLADYGGLHRSKTLRQVWGEDDDHQGSDAVRLLFVELTQPRHHYYPAFDYRAEFTLRVGYSVLSPCEDLLVGFDMTDSKGTLICGSNNVAILGRHICTIGQYIWACTFPGHIFNAGTYSFAITLHDAAKVHLRPLSCVTLDLIDPVGLGPNSWKVHGITRPLLRWRSETYSASTSIDC